MTNREIATRLRQLAVCADDSQCAVCGAGCGDAMVVLREAADALERTEWISVEERLPEVGKTVLPVYRNTIFDNPRFFHKTLKYTGNMWEDEKGYRYFERNVPYWMPRAPLPEPPKEESE